MRSRGGCACVFVGVRLCAHAPSSRFSTVQPSPCPSSALQRETARGTHVLTGGFAVSLLGCALPVGAEGPGQAPSSCVSVQQARGHAEAQDGTGGAGEGFARGAGGSAAGAEDERHRRQREPEAAGRAGQVTACGVCRRDSGQTNSLSTHQGRSSETRSSCTFTGPVMLTTGW